MSPYYMYILEQFCTVLCESRDSHVQTFWIPEKNYEYMKWDLQVKKSNH